MSEWNSNDMGGNAPQQDSPDAVPAAQDGGAAQTTDVAPIPGWTEREAFDYAAMAPGGEVARPSDGAAPIYQWNDDFGDVGPKHPELEIQLFGDPETRERTGLDFSNIESINVIQEGPVQIKPIRTFKDAGLHPVMYENVQLCGYAAPTPIQKYTIPSMLQGYDVIGVAQTGSGKTAAYLLPIMSKLMGKAKKWAAPRPNPATFRPGIDEVTAEPLVLIVVPTRELAVQIFNDARRFCYRTMLRPCVVYGGINIGQQLDLLSKGCDILIGTPGRLVDFIHRPRNLTLRRLKYMILDEADEMLDQGWEEDLRQILSGGEQDEGNIKFGLFSATFPKQAKELAREYLADNHVRFRVGRAGSTTENIKQVVIQAERHEKRELLLRVLEEMSGIRTIIFANGRQEVDNLDDFLYNTGLPVTSIHGDRTQTEREHAMRAFRSGNAPILVATGVCARGIDVRNVMHVINYDLPNMEHGGIEEYTHRIGRTGRIGHRGVATSFFSERDEPMGNVLARTLMETKQEVPDFLQLFLDGETADNLHFECDSDFDEQEAMGGATAGGDDSAGGFGSNGVQDSGGNGAWGGNVSQSAANDTAPTPAGGGGWGGDQTTPAASGW